VGFLLYGIRLTPAKCPTNQQSLSNSAPANLCFRASGEILPEQGNPRDNNGWNIFTRSIHAARLRQFAVQKRGYPAVLWEHFSGPRSGESHGWGEQWVQWCWAFRNVNILASLRVNNSELCEGYEGSQLSQRSIHSSGPFTLWHPDGILLEHGNRMRGLQWNRGFKKPTIWLFADWTPWAPRMAIKAPN